MTRPPSSSELLKSLDFCIESIVLLNQELIQGLEDAETLTDQVECKNDLSSVVSSLSSLQQSCSSMNNIRLHLQELREPIYQWSM